MNEETANKLIDKLRDCEDIALSGFRAKREKIDGKQEGYQEAMYKARQIILDYIEEDK